jgi:hypothetical protein
MIDSRVISLHLLTVIILAASSFAQNDWRTKPYTGQDYSALIAGQDLPLQEIMEERFGEDQGYFISGPLDPLFKGGRKASDVYHTVRVICPDHQSLNDALDLIWKDTTFIVLVTDRCLTGDCENHPMGYRGAFVKFIKDDAEYLVQFVSLQHIRWMVWARYWLGGNDPSIEYEKLGHFGRAISDHLFAVDRKWDFIPEPNAQAFGLSAKFSLYREPPQCEFSSHQDLDQYFLSHAGINNDFATGILSFRPTDSLLAALMTNAPQEAYPNKSEPLLQHQYRNFFDNDGDLRIMKTLTREVFDSLAAGNYFFAVNLSGKIRFSRAYSSDEVEKIENKIGSKMPQANQAFLFPGEAVLSAGFFEIERDSVPRLTRVNAKSESFFYSNIISTIRRDISVKSNHYIRSLGHFFAALEKAGISLENIIISKF